jgi:acyl-CoA dehydrogenase
MAFQFSERALDLQRRVKDFIDTEIIPAEKEYKQEVDAARKAGNAFIVPGTIERLKAKARAAGLWNLFLPASELGAGLCAS